MAPGPEKHPDLAREPVSGVDGEVRRQPEHLPSPRCSNTGVSPGMLGEDPLQVAR